VETSEFDVDGLEKKGLRGMTTDIAGMAALLWTSVVLCFSDTPNSTKSPSQLAEEEDKSQYTRCVDSEPKEPVYHGLTLLDYAFPSNQVP
jgi:hypothetical protein